MAVQDASRCQLGDANGVVEGSIEQVAYFCLLVGEGESHRAQQG